MIFFIRLLSISFMIIFLNACQNKTDKAQTEKLQSSRIHQPAKNDNPLKGKIFVYALGCTWNSQSQFNGMLSFDNTNKFKFEWRKLLNKKKVKDAPPNYFEYEYQDEILEGIYEIGKSGKIAFKIEDYQYKNITKQEDYDLPFQKAAKPEVEITARLDSCEDKSRLVFSSTNHFIPSEKYFEWVEKNYSGSYISYNEGVREELIIKDLQDNIKVFYHSPRYKRPIDLIVKKYDRSKLQVNFPNDMKTTYQISFNENFLTSYATVEGVETNEYDKYQIFKKIKNQYTDNPKDLSLKTLNRSQLATKQKSSIDTVLYFKENVKIKFTSTTSQEFKKYFKDIVFEKLREQNCIPYQENYYAKSYACLQKNEALLLQKNPLVKRDGDMLIFELQNNRKHFLKTNHTFGESTREFWYQDGFKSPKGNISIALGYFWEWSNYHILHHESGEEIEVSGTPYFSPDGQYFICYQNLELYTMGGICIQIWEIKEYGFDLVWQYQPSFIAEKFAWANQNTIYFDVVEFNQTGKEIKNYGKMEFLGN